MIMDAIMMYSLLSFRKNVQLENSWLKWHVSAPVASHACSIFIRWDSFADSHLSMETWWKKIDLKLFFHFNSPQIKWWILTNRAITLRAMTQPQTNHFINSLALNPISVNWFGRFASSCTLRSASFRTRCLTCLRLLSVLQPVASNLRHSIPITLQFVHISHFMEINDNMYVCIAFYFHLARAAGVSVELKSFLAAPSPSGLKIYIFCLQASAPSWW